MRQRILLLQIAALGYNFLQKNLNGEGFYNLPIRPLQGLFPALTCPVQATMRTSSLPARHGIVGNGFFFKEEWKPLFWEQSSKLIQGGRIWDGFRLDGGKVAQMFIQQSLGIDSDIVLSPAPVHKHHGGMILDCFTEPPGLNERLRRELGGVFPLQNYWGPLASEKSSWWITKAVTSVMRKERPGLLYAYLPHLDYELQRYGPDSPKSKKAFSRLCNFLDEIIFVAEKTEYRVVLFGDYSITEARNVIYPNKVLRMARLFKTRLIDKRLYPNYFTSTAFCIADHQIAHVQVFDLNRLQEVKGVVENIEGVDMALDRQAQAEAGIDHHRSGDLVLVAKPGYWFDYRWWEERKESPDYATHIDIHNKPGYDPCELFWGYPPLSVCQNPSRIKGTHGRVDKGEPAFFASDLETLGDPQNLLDLSKALKRALDSYCSVGSASIRGKKYEDETKGISSIFL